MHLTGCFCIIVQVPWMRKQVTIDRCGKARKPYQRWAEHCVFVSKEWRTADLGGVLFAQSVKKRHLAEVALGVPLELELAVARLTLRYSSQDDTSVSVDRASFDAGELCRRKTLRSAGDLLSIVVSLSIPPTRPFEAAWTETRTTTTTPPSQPPGEKLLTHGYSSRALTPTAIASSKTGRLHYTNIHTTARLILSILTNPHRCTTNSRLASKVDEQPHHYDHLTHECC